MHYIMNSIVLVPLRESINRIGKKLMEENIRNQLNVLENVQPHRLEIFLVDRIDATNLHGLIVEKTGI